MSPLELANPLAELSESNAFENSHDGVTDLLHDAANPADIFIRTGTAFVKFFTHTTDRRERAFDEPNDTRERNFLRREAQAVPAGDAPSTLQNACGAQIVEDLFQEALGNILLLGDCLDAYDILLRVQTKNNQCSKRIFPSER